MDAKKTALILVGYQNDYFAADGLLRGAFDDQARVDSVLAKSLAFIRALADTPVTIISTPLALSPDYRAMASPVGILNAIKEAGAFRYGTRGADTIPELSVFGNRIVYVQGKEGFNAFSNTELERTIKERGITDVLVAGLVTSLCVDSTGRAAYERGYNVTILSDCTSGRTQAEQDFYCQTIFPLYGSVATSTQLVQQLAPVAVA